MIPPVPILIVICAALGALALDMVFMIRAAERQRDEENERLRKTIKRLEDRDEPGGSADSH